ncbi:hypothetical protein LMG28138_03608 [Pararobbsia alpina]|uniref:Uncharacterized protein n=1 Tax=Pararobbsia alpina TaxID=621374 RepID=A0A6S7BBM1_9BURK|nr:hypothetical protein LMG28138_03608 [Pararobbsia alpina]
MGQSPQAIAHRLDWNEATDVVIVPDDQASHSFDLPCTQRNPRVLPGFIAVPSYKFEMAGGVRRFVS